MINKEAKYIIKSYLKKVSKYVVCTYTVKKLFIKDLKLKLFDYFESNNQITLDLIHSHFGTPEEIAVGFKEQKLEKFITQAKKLKIIIAIVVMALIFLLVFLYIILSEYAGTITITG